MIVEEKNEGLVSPRVYIKTKVGSRATVTDWRNYKWQLNNSIKTIAAFEEFTDIAFSEQEKSELEKTIRKFPLCITPYYASLIDKKNYLNDPIFKQAFPNPAELKISKCIYQSRI